MTEHEFPDTMAMPRRARIDFVPEWYEKRSGLGMCHGDACNQGRKPCPTPDACRLCAEDADSAFGALEGLTRGVGWIAAAWAVVAAAAFVAYIIWS